MRSLLALVLVAGASATAAPANAAFAHPAYVAGTAHAYKLTFPNNGSTGQFHCSFAGWAGVTVNYTCDIYVGTSIAASHSGSFTGPSFTSPTYTFTTSGACYSTRAVAAYSDGSASASNQTACV